MAVLQATLISSSYGLVRQTKDSQGRICRHSFHVLLGLAMKRSNHQFKLIIGVQKETKRTYPTKPIHPLH